MCVISLSPVGVNAPTEQNLKDMFKHNDDGAGISFVLDKAVYTYKGLMKWSDFEKTYALIEKKLRTAGKTFKDVPIMYHFRIGTHGPNSEALTHPFPISNQFKHLTALEYKADIVMAHNGIIHSVVPRAGWSDTQQYISDIIMPLIKTDRHFYKNKHLQELMRNTNNGSRFAFLDMDGNFTTVGEFVESDSPELKGILYSNLNHEYVFSKYNYDYSYAYTPTASYPTAATYNSLRDAAFCVPVPVGAKLYTAEELTPSLTPVAGATGYTVKKGQENLYWADEYGELFRMEGDGGYIYPVKSFHFAMDDIDEIYSLRPDLSKSGEVLYYGPGVVL